MDNKISTGSQEGIKKEFEWRVYPAKERIGSTVATSFVILAIVLSIYLSIGSLLWGLIAFVVLVLSLNRFFFPSRFTVDSQGITAQYLFSKQRYHWSDIRRWHPDRYGIYLSTRKRISRFDAFRGLNILFGQYREEVLKRIKVKIQQAASS